MLDTCIQCSSMDLKWFFFFPPKFRCNSSAVCIRWKLNYVNWMRLNRIELWLKPNLVLCTCRYVMCIKRWMFFFVECYSWHTWGLVPPSFFKSPNLPDCNHLGRRESQSSWIRSDGSNPIIKENRWEVVPFTKASVKLCSL